jgi:hypothetical protein
MCYRAWSGNRIQIDIASLPIERRLNDKLSADLGAVGVAP